MSLLFPRLSWNAAEWYANEVVSTPHSTSPEVMDKIADWFKEGNLPKRLSMTLSALKVKNGKKVMDQWRA